MNSVKLQVWNGSINVRILYKEHEFLLAVHRTSYFPLHYRKFVQFFSNITNNDITKHSCWLEYEYVPLKWNLPAGVLYDLLYLSSSPEDRCWTLNLRVASVSSSFPSDDIIPYEATENGPDYELLVSKVYINHLKQLCYVTNGNSRAVLTLSEDDTKLLWRSIVNHDYGTYTAINKKVLPKKEPQRIPIEVFLAGLATTVQLPVYPTKNGESVSLHSVLRESLPQLFNEGKAKASIHGIDVDVLYEEQILEIWQHFRHLDNFLYVVVAV